MPTGEADAGKAVRRGSHGGTGAAGRGVVAGRGHGGRRRGEGGPAELIELEPTAMVANGHGGHGATSTGDYARGEGGMGVELTQEREGELGKAEGSKGTRIKVAELGGRDGEKRRLRP